MILIVTEKGIAGRRIAAILAGEQVPEERDGAASFFCFKKGGEDYVVVPLKGHIMNVDFPKSYSHWIGTDLKQLTKAPVEYVGMQKGIISLLKKKAKGVDEVIVATDADREGEAIGVEALDYIKQVNKKVKIKRAYFSAITPKDINTAFSNLVEVDYHFADSANARREIDLIWGAVLTRFLSLVSGRLGKEFLSAGRVQTPTLGLIVNREKERLAFQSKKYWVVSALFAKQGKEFLAEHKKGKFWEKGEAEKVMGKKAKQGRVSRVAKTMRTLSRPIPFNTTGFLRAASAIGINAGEAMNIAETLYMQGFISYPRTDNTTYSATLDLKEILNALLPNPEFTDAVAGILARGRLDPSQGKVTKDHPPIHPVSNASMERLPPRQWKIYELICRHFFATLGEDAKTENLNVEIDLNGEPFIARGQLLVYPGFVKFYPYTKLKEVELPELNEGDEVDLKKLEMLGKETQPPARFSQGVLIKLMEQNGLGTKATRHEIIQKLYFRQYISGLKMLEPNKIGFAVIDSLEKHEAQLEKPEMTAELEKEMDEIAAGKKSRNEVVEDSRKILLKVLVRLLEHKNDIGSELRAAARQDNILTDCPTCDGKLRILRGKTGKRFLGCTNYPKCTTTFPLPQLGKIIALEKKCPECGQPMIKVFSNRRGFEMCLDPQCKSKEAWRKKAAAKAKAVGKK